jgi:hypothetical protein
MDAMKAILYFRKYASFFPHILRLFFGLCENPNEICAHNATDLLCLL